MEITKTGWYDEMYTCDVLHPPPAAVARYTSAPSSEGLSEFKVCEESAAETSIVFCKVVEYNTKVHNEAGALTEAELNHLRDYARVLAWRTSDARLEAMAEAAGRLMSARERLVAADAEDREVFERMKNMRDEGHMSMADFNTFLRGQRLDRMERNEGEEFKIEKKVEIQNGKWRVGRSINPGVTQYHDLEREPTELEKATVEWEAELRKREQLNRRCDRSTERFVQETYEEVEREAMADITEPWAKAAYAEGKARHMERAGHALHLFQRAFAARLVADLDALGGEVAAREIEGGWYENYVAEFETPKRIKKQGERVGNTPSGSPELTRVRAREDEADEDDADAKRLRCEE